MRRLLGLVLLCTACGGDNPAPVAPTPQATACQTNNTASVRFGNRSQGTTQDIFWDGSRLFTLTPGQDSSSINAAAGVAHHLEFRITNSNIAACQASSPVLAQCSTPIYTCAFP